MAVNNQYFNFGIAFLGTAYSKGAYDYLPKHTIVDGCDEAKLVEYLNTLQQYEEQTGIKPPPNFIILDDIMDHGVSLRITRKYSPI